MQITSEPLDFTATDLDGFVGGWSLNSHQMARAFSHVEGPGNELRVLEFGAGKSTKHLASLLASAGAPFRYVSYEDDPVFADPVPGVETILWREFPTQLVEGIFDLVLIDGPAGVDRARWYPLLRDRVRIGTIMVLDDFDVYPEFAAALEANFEYELYDDMNLRKRPGQGCITWKTVRVLGCKPLESHQSRAACSSEITGVGI